MNSSTHVRRIAKRMAWNVCLGRSAGGREVLLRGELKQVQQGERGAVRLVLFPVFSGLSPSKRWDFP